MDLLIVRHAIATDKKRFSKTKRPDSERPLTAEGRRKMKRISRMLRTLVPELDALLTSPYVRAAQTAEIVRSRYPGLKGNSERALEPGGDYGDLLAVLAKFRSGATIALVGHEPALSLLIGWLLVGRRESFVELKKGGACLISFDSRPRAASGHLAWLMRPSQLRRS
jgi:phosphohistidine phosphatase